MAGTAMETEGVIALADGLINSQVSSLRELDISENSISELEAAMHVAKIIAKTNLQTLRLNRNPLGDAGVCELADALGSEPCPALRSLELGSCRVGNLGATVLLRSSRRHTNSIGQHHPAVKVCIVGN
ncbi:Ribonuclease inhibitor [Durusdinium trenchii]|uniref:Ribonuclease inhibitor n=2 Tax=Durusdinium trenchii TaxID=1381693 RepID=A0ABP0NJC6_9DINO